MNKVRILEKSKFKLISSLTNKLLFIILLISIAINIIILYEKEFGSDMIIFGENHDKELKSKNDTKSINNGRIKNSIYKYLYIENKYLTNGRITAFTNADDIYINYIPIFCASLLYCDKRNRTDIEIVVNINKLPNKILKSLEYLRTIYIDSKIIIRYNMYHTVKKYAFINKNKMLHNSVRYFIEPKLKNEYVFIGDIDIVYLVDNYYDNYLMDMFNRSSCYSNIVRPNTKRLSGIHFSKWFCLYPIIISKKLDLMKNDEKLLYKRVKNLGVEIDHLSTYRPVFGIHMSVNRPSVVNSNNITWEAFGKKKLWTKFKKSQVYKYIYPLLDKYIINKIELLEKYYKNND